MLCVANASAGAKAEFGEVLGGVVVVDLERRAVVALERQLDGAARPRLLPGGLDLFTAMLAAIATRETVTAAVAFVTAVISVYSSTSGVVLPAFLPTVPGLAERLHADPMDIASSMNVGGHLVDLSPLSTIGALCLSAGFSVNSIVPVSFSYGPVFPNDWPLATVVTAGCGIGKFPAAPCGPRRDSPNDPRLRRTRRRISRVPQSTRCER